jgi:gliding motility-associated-like protein
MKLKLVLFISLFFNFAFSQGEANIWYFGIKAGLDFNSGSPVTLTNGRLDTEEGCATLSNLAGQLLFYTDGSTVYNKNHTVMLNGSGLMGHYSTTQSATIVPKPGSSNLFYVFTIDVQAGANGFRYSIIDSTLDGGLGGITSDKNILIYTPTCEKIAIVKHCNNVDFWIVTHEWNNNTFNAHLLTSSGLNTIPAVSNTGITPTGLSFQSIGYMKLSPDGSKLAICHAGDFEYEKGIVQLFDFNNSTGIVSNAKSITSVDVKEHLYGLEFSPNSKILYVSQIEEGNIFQFDLNAISIAYSKVVVHHTNTTSLGALQLGPDGKIYIAENYRPKIGVINNPNVLGLGCNLQMDAIDLMSGTSRYGLPAFSQSFFFNPTIEFENTCVHQNAQFELNTNQTTISATWDFGDGSPTNNNIVATHTYSIAGTYTVTVTATSICGTTIITKNIIIAPVPIATQPQNMLEYEDNNGFHQFDLTTRNSAILNGQNPSLYTVKYYANATDYINKVAIATPNSYQNAIAYQQQNIIAEVSNNAYTDCSSTTTTFTIGIAVLNIPDYFTPNGDGYNDYWNIKSANKLLIPIATIYIFDRYGKLLIQIGPTSLGWNGTYNNQKMPSTDYWYSIELKNGKILKGHFALKR